ncbi:MAG: hypothetical protein C0423_17000 [Methylibium sp.]|nr:hypothetical protein [Methylibium sp.]
MDSQLQAIATPLPFDEHCGQLLDAWTDWRHALAAEPIPGDYQPRKFDDFAGLGRHRWEQQAS